MIIIDRTNHVIEQIAMYIYNTSSVYEYVIRGKVEMASTGEKNPGGLPPRTIWPNWPYHKSCYKRIPSAL